MTEEEQYTQDTLLEPEIPEELENLVHLGNKALAQQKFEDAVDHFAEASEKLNGIRGELHPLNAGVIFLYAQSLFHLAIQQSEVLGEDAAPNDAFASVADMIRSKLVDEGIIPVSATAEASSSEAANQESSESPKGEIGDADEQHSDKKEEAAESQDDTQMESLQQDEAKEDEDERDDFTLAWESFELSRLLFEHQRELTPNEADKLKIDDKLAQIHDFLGELSLDNGDIETAIQDLSTSLKLKLKVYKNKENPSITEAYYKLGLAYQASQNTPDKEEGIKCIDKAIETLDGWINLKKSADNSEKPLTEEELQNAALMLDELKEKASSLKEELHKTSADQLGEASGSRNLEPKVADISNLVKRKPRDTESSTNTETKKQKT